MGEFDLSSMGILFQLKYNNPANPFEGGRAHVKVPGARFIRNAPFDDMDLDIEFNGGSAIDGLFDMKVNYKFIQKFMFLALFTRSSGLVMVRPPRDSFAGFPQWRPTWLPVSTSGTLRLTPSYGSPLLDRSTASPSPTTSSHFWRESTDYCIFLGSQLQKYKMAIRPQKYKIVFHYLA